MYLFHNIGERVNSNYNTREEIERLAPGTRISFDGVYENVWRNRDLIRFFDVIQFITGDYIGRDNAFDAPMPLERFCDWNQIMELHTLGAKLGWHTWSHRDLTLLSDADLLHEVTPPFPMKYFAYPYGKYDARVIQAVKDAGFEEAWSVTQGDGNPHSQSRIYLNW